MKVSRWSSLEFALPLLIITLLVVMVAVGSLLAYHEVRVASFQSGEARLERVSAELAEVMARSVGNALARHEATAAQPELQTVIMGSDQADSSRVMSSLDELRPSGSTLPVELWNSEDSLVLAVGAYPDHWSPEEIAEARARIAGIDSSSFGPLYLVDDVPYAWITVPVLDEGGSPVGQVARVAAFTNINAAEVSALIGSSAEIFLTNVSGGPWVTLDGRVADASPASPFDSIVAYDRADGERYIAKGQAIGSQPLAVVAEAPLSASMVRPASFLRNLLMGTVVLLLIGVVAAWLLSRRITRPLAELRAAAHDVAGGNYARRVHITGANELGDLARAFSHMAAEVQSTHSALNVQYEEARDLAQRLEATNERIVDAILEAEHARSEAELANRAKSDFLTTMSHEIRTPINAIVGYADLLKMEIAGPLNEKQRAHLQRLESSSRHLLQLVNEILDLATVESGNLKLSAAEAGAVATIQSACTIVAPGFAAKDIRLNYPEKDDRTSMYQGDPERVKQILINLLSNAAKFTPNGGRVDVTVDADIDEVRFVVVDTGPGVPAPQQEAIFAPFVQIDSSLTRVHGGAGLGLAISRKLARMMGGDLTVRSEPGRGARFTLHMPAALARAGATC
jgi:signal transduction histidine kinase